VYNKNNTDVLNTDCLFIQYIALTSSRFGYETLKSEYLGVDLISVYYKGRFFPSLKYLDVHIHIYVCVFAFFYDERGSFGVP
jgi:hypothetical protein